MKSLLILSCSQTKRSNVELLPALERYDGPAFRLLRKFLHQKSDLRLDIYIISARFGLIAGSRLIPDYDQKLTKGRSLELNIPTIDSLRKLLNSQNYEEILICVTKSYLSVLNGVMMLLPEHTKVTIATGTIGRKLSILRQWLYRENQPVSHIPSLPSVPKETIQLKGVEISLRNEKILNLARQALAKDKQRAYNYQTWYIWVDDTKVSPKWLVSLLTGLPVSSFHSQAARRVLQQLGIKVHSNLE